MANPGLQPEGEKRATKKRFGSYIIVTLVILLAFVVGVVIGTRSDELAFKFGLEKKPITQLDLTTVQQTYNKLKRNYDGTLHAKKLIEGANKGLVEAAGDPYTVYLTKEEAKAFDDDLEGMFTGIGAELDKRDSKLIIVAPLDNSPAKRAGLLAGDIIARVNNEDTSSWSIDKAVSRIKGKKDTTVKLTIVRADQVLEFTITRDNITAPSVKTEKKGDVGVIRISRFGDDTAHLVRSSAATLVDEGIKGVVIDVRGNGGGYLTAAQEIASLWLKTDQVVVTERKGSRVVDSYRSNGNPFLDDIPTVVLIDQGSASASEILAGSLQDHKKAKLVGEKSFGKGSVQMLVNLPRDAKLKVTTAKWYTPKGKNISREGITPDVTTSLPKSGSSNTAEDTQMAKALELVVAR